MAYISKEKVAEIRANLKKEFPDIKFSVRRDNHISLDVSIMKAPYHFFSEKIRLTWNTASVSGEQKTLPYCGGINHYWIENSLEYDNHAILQKIVDICMEGNHDNSVVQADYFDVGWYFNLNVGKWDNPFQYTGK